MINLNNNIPPPTYLKEPQDCSICLDELSIEIATDQMPEERNVEKFLLINKDDRTPLQTNCNHIFHYECLKKWVAKERQKTNCPVCRHNFKFFSDRTIPEVVDDQEEWREIMERYGYEEMTMKDLLKHIIVKIKGCCVLVGLAVMGKLIWNGFTVNLLDSSVKDSAFRAVKFFGWPTVAFAVGALFISFLPCLRCRRPNPELGLKYAFLPLRITIIIETFLLGPLNVLSLGGNVIVGGAALLLVVLAYAKRCFYGTPPIRVNYNYRFN